MTLAAGVRLGPYEVVDLLGAGGMGAVYRARDPRLGRDVAVKVLSGDVAADRARLRRFEQEARAVAALNHPHIVTIHDVGTHEGTPYVVTELLEGENLREVLSHRAPTQRQILSWAVQTAQGLAAAHQKGIVHRDLSPKNLFVTTDGQVKILDFGLAKLARRALLDTEAVTESGPTQPGLLIGTVPYMSPEQVRGLAVDARSDIFSFGVVVYELLARRHPFRGETVAATLAAILHESPAHLRSVDPSIPPAVDGIVRRCLEKRKEERFQGAHDLALALEAVLAAPVGSALLDEMEERSPYPGLLSFTERDASVFFGREAEVKTLWEKVRQKRLLAVIGPSGAGKTSFLRAGVVPARPAGYAAIVCTPGTAPMRGLARALAPELGADAEALSTLPDFDEPDVAFALLSRWRRAHGDAVVVVDQFEELFTLNAPEEQARFAALVGRLVTEADVQVVLSLRDDFLLRCSDHAPLAPVFESLIPLTKLNQDGLRRALTEPARRRGYRFEDDALVEEMVSSVEDVRGALPLLAFAVARLWEKRDRERKIVTRGAHEEIGGVGGALAQHAEALMERIGPERQGLVREIFRNLVTAHGTRAVIDREELLSAFPDPAAAEEVLRQLIDARLVTSYEVERHEGAPNHHRVEIVHESLLAAWPRLVRWEAQDEEGAVLRDQLKQAAHLWDEKGRTADLLWTGTAYREFALWRERYPGALTSLEDEFARAMAGRAQRTRRLRRAAVTTVIAGLIVVSAAIWHSRQKAVEAALRSEAARLLVLGEAKLTEDPTEALAYATASVSLADSPEARVFAVRALAEAPPAIETISDVTNARLPQFSPDGASLAVAGHSSEVGVWSQNGGPPIRLPGHTMSPRGGNLAVWASNHLLVTGLTDGATEAYVWSLPGGKRERTIEFGAPSWWQVGPHDVFAETVESGSAEAPGLIHLRSWRLADGSPRDLGRVDWRSVGWSSSAFAPTGEDYLYAKGRDLYAKPLPVGRGADRVLGHHADRVEVFPLRDSVQRVWSSDGSGEVRLWSFSESGARSSTTIPKPLTAPSNIVPSVSGRWLVNRAQNDAKVRLWDTQGLPGARPLELRRFGSWYSAFSAIHPGEQWLVATTASMSRLTFWPLPDRRVSVVDGYAAHWRPMAFSPDSRWLATSWADGRLRLWPLSRDGSGEVRVLKAPQGVQWISLAFDPKGRYLFALGFQDNAWIVPLDGSPARRLAAFSKDTMLADAAVSPTGRFVATAFFYGQEPKTLRVWDAETGALRLFDLPVPPRPQSPVGGVAAQTGYEGGINSLAFASDSVLYTAGHGGIRRWNLETKAVETVLSMSDTESAYMTMSADLRWASVGRDPLRASTVKESCAPVEVLDLAAGTLRTHAEYGECPQLLERDSSGTVLAVASPDGTVRVGRYTGGEAHILAGHAGAVSGVDVSPDLHWIATSGEDNTLRLWPMPDLDTPPLHTLPRVELLAKLGSLTNLRAVKDPATGAWRIDLDPFPGWKNVP